SSLSSLLSMRRNECAEISLLEERRQKTARVSSPGTRRLLLVLLSVLFGAISAIALPLAEYRSRIHQAITELESIKEIRKSERAPEHADRVARTFNTVLQLVSLEKPVEWGDTRVVVNNS